MASAAPHWDSAGPSFPAGLWAATFCLLHAWLSARRAADGISNALLPFMVSLNTINLLLEGWKKGQIQRGHGTAEKEETKCWREEAGEGEIFYVKRHHLFFLGQIVYPNHRITAYAWSSGI